MTANRRLVCLFAALLACSPAVARADGPAADVVGVAVAAPTPDGKGQSAVFGRRPGVEITVIATGNLKVLAYDPASSKLSSFVDDKGTDLSKTEGWGDLPWLSPFYSGSSSSADEPEPPFSFSIVSSVMPAKGATTLTLDATIGLITGTDLKTDETKDVALTKGTKLKLGNIDVELSDVGKSYDEKQTTLAFSTSSRLDAIQSVEFVDAAGKPIPSDENGRSTMSMNGDSTYSISYAVPHGTTKATLRVKYYATSKVVPLTIKRTIGVGL